MDIRKSKLFITFLIILLIPILFVLINRTLHKDEITIAVGGVDGAYYSYALKYQKLLKKEGVDLKILTTQGSLEAQNKLLNKEADFAFIQGGTEFKDKGLFALANIAYEPVWIFYNEANITSLSEFEGKKIAIGGKESGIFPVATTLLLANKIDESNSELLHLSSSKASKQLQAKTIDAMFYVASADSKLVEKLLQAPDVRLMDFTNSADAYKQYFLKKHKGFYVLKLEAGGFDFRKNIPKTTHTLLSKKSILSTLNASDEMSRLLLKVADKVHQDAGMFHKEYTFPNAKMLKIEQHRASIEYFKEREYFYERLTDFWTAQSLNYLHNFVLIFFLPILMLFAFFVEVIVPTAHWYSRRKIVVWYDKINAIDTGIEQLSPKEAKAKREEVEQILQKVRAMDDIPAFHMEEFYALQNQISNILDDLQKMIKP